MAFFLYCLHSHKVRRTHFSSIKITDREVIIQITANKNSLLFLFSKSIFSMPGNLLFRKVRI